MSFATQLLDYRIFLPVRPLLFKALERLSRASGLHPTCFKLEGLQKLGRQVAAGAFGDVWKSSVRGQTVSIKVMRLFEEGDVRTLLKEFGREALVWRQISHPNLLPFLGMYYLDERLCLVSPWMENGNILQFMTKNPSQIEHRSLILDIARGVEYLHSEQVVHGDLKGMNILVTPAGNACIADFGLSSVVDAMTQKFSHSSITLPKGTTRWQAPELLRGVRSNHFGSDIYAFSCVCYEIMTQKAPFYELAEPAIPFKVVSEGFRPTRPEHWPTKTAKHSDAIWQLMEDCWHENPDVRPQASSVVQRLGGPLIEAELKASTAAWDEKFTSKFRRSLQARPLLPSITQIEGMIFGDGVSLSNS
ncbi:kinase-like domain-containing protein [Mycena crocata]|nr:kinase-like domain-containing protein [Mycena crocata]